MTESFQKIGIPDFICNNLSDLGYTKPTDIQMNAIPKALEGFNIIGLSQTGTGKTAAFLLPIITNLLQGKSKARMPRCLIICPTRELAAQVLENFESYSKGAKINAALLIGGVSFNLQEQKLDKSVDLIIATPGRLLDHFERGKIVLTGVEIIAIDEADKMLDMGFIPDVTRILELIPRVRQKVLFSATMGPEIDNLINRFIGNPYKVEVSPSATVTKNVHQSLILLDKLTLKKDKFLIKFLQKNVDIFNAIIFCNRKKDVSKLKTLMENNGLLSGEIHGDLNQQTRNDIVNKFKGGKVKYLVASDIAARGLDIPNVSHVINFDVPTNPEDYVHRIGRTGRAGKTGIALTLAQKKDMPLIKTIESLIKEKIKINIKDLLNDSDQEFTETDKTKAQKFKDNIQKDVNFLPEFLFAKFDI